jgi:hypothetical protein
MTTTTTTTHPFDSLKIAPIACTSWCRYGDGHPNETGRADQTCWGADHYVEASTEEVLAEYDKGTDTWNAYASQLGISAYRGFNQHPSVYVHINLPAAPDDGVDTSVWLTADEARQLAAYLIEVADEIGERTD